MKKMTNAAYDEEGLYFMPLGGCEQFGVNLNVYVCDGEFLIVDCGIGFADERYPGIDLLLPDPSLLEKNKKRLNGLIITHAHEDHIGAVAYLYERLRCRLYCTPFTVEILKNKLEECGRKDAEIHVIEPMQEFELGIFKIKPLPVSHSIPDTCAMLIETPYGKVMHSADWNLDQNTVVGYKSDASIFKEVGDQGVLAYIGDSTNSDKDGFSGSEADVAAGLEKEFASCEGRILVTTFSSNVGRLITIARAAEACGRQVGVIGRSMHRMLGAAADCGFLDGEPHFLDSSEFNMVADDSLVVIATGSQGEGRAALAKIARGDNRDFKLKQSDTVIFSARAIPGNEKDINQIKNNLVAGGIKVISPPDTDNVIHVSGHPCRGEITQMYQWLRPNTVIPVHGERAHLAAQGRFARECQIPNVIVPQNGSVIRLAPGTPELIDHVPAGLLLLDQKRIIAADHVSVSNRRKLQYSGVVHVSVAINGNGKLLAPPEIDTIGLIDENDPAEEQFADNLLNEVLDLFDEMDKRELKDDHFVHEELRIGVRRFVYHFLGIKPKVTIHAIRIK